MKPKKMAYGYAYALVHRATGAILSVAPLADFLPLVKPDECIARVEIREVVKRRRRKP